MDNNTKIFLGFLTGVLAGVAAGLLLAPEKGDATRKLLAEKAKNQLGPGWEKANEFAKTVGETISESLNEYSQKIFKKGSKPEN